MARRRYTPQKKKPYRANASTLKFNPCWRCAGCGAVYTKEDSLIVFKAKKPTQCKCGSITFDYFHSTGEAKRYATLLLFESTGKISSLRTQVRFPLYTIGPSGLKTKVCDYIADFEYDDHDGRRVVEEFKGGMTDVAALKLKWFERQYGFAPKISQG